MSETENAAQTGAGNMAAAESSVKQGSIARLKELFVNYGTIGLVTWLSIFALTWGGFATALALGFELDSASSGAGVIGAAYLATQLTKPIRIGATIVLTPVVAKVWYRFRPTPERQNGSSEKRL